MNIDALWQRYLMLKTLAADGPGLGFSAAVVNALTAARDRAAREVVQALREAYNQ